MERISVLHRLSGSKGEGVIVDARKRVIPDPTWPALSLGDDARRTKGEAIQRSSNVKRYDDPLALANHVGKLLLEKGDMVGTGLVWATKECFLQTAMGPRLGVRADWAPVLLEMGKVVIGRVGIRKGADISATTTTANKGIPTKLLNQCSIVRDVLT